MTTQNKIPNFWGGCELKSSLTLEALAEILSREIFSGAKFGGKEKSIHEEIPAVFIESSFLGMLVVLEGYSGMDNWFVLSTKPYGKFNRFLSVNEVETERVDLDMYLYYLLKQSLLNYSEILVIEPKNQE